MLSSYEELDYVRDHISDRLEKGLAQRGFIVLNWGDAGWVHFFTKQPASHPDDIRRMKLCVLQGDTATFELYKINGFHPVSLAATDILTGLQTGLIDAFQSPPLIALSNQWFGGAKNMLDIPFAQLVGATVIDKDVWDKIPAPVQKEMLRPHAPPAWRCAMRFANRKPAPIPLMQQFGLNVVHADAKAVAEWRQLAESIWPKLRGPWCRPTCSTR